MPNTPPSSQKAKDKSSKRAAQKAKAAEEAATREVQEPTGKTPKRGGNSRTAAEEEMDALEAKLAEARKRVEDEKEQEKIQALAAEAEEQWKHFISYAKLDTTKENLLASSVGIANIKDLKELGSEPETSLLKAEGFNFLQAKRIANAAKFALAGGIFTKDTDVDTIRECLSQQTMVTPPNTPAKTASSNISEDKDPEYYLARAEVDSIDPFSDDPADFEDCWKGVTSRLGPTRSGQCLTNPPDPSRPIQETSNCALCHILAHAFRGCTVEADINKTCEIHGENGCEVSQAMTSHCRSDAIKSQVQRRLRAQPQDTKLVGNPQTFTEIGAHLSEWQLLHQKLQDAGEVWTDHKKRDEFLEGIQLDPSNPVQQMKVAFSRELDTLTFDKALQDIDNVARTAFPEATSKASHSKARRQSSNTGDATDGLAWEDVRIPNHVLDKLRKDLSSPDDAKKAIGIILRWRTFLVEERRQPTEDEMKVPSRKRKSSHTTSNPGGASSKTRRIGSTPQGEINDDRKQVTIVDPACSPTDAAGATGEPKSTVKVIVKDCETMKALEGADSNSESDTSQDNNDAKQTPTNGKGKSRRGRNNRKKTRQVSSGTCED